MVESLVPLVMAAADPVAPPPTSGSNRDLARRLVATLCHPACTRMAWPKERLLGVIANLCDHKLNYNCIIGYIQPQRYDGTVIHLRDMSRRDERRSGANFAVPTPR